MHTFTSNPFSHLWHPMNLLDIWYIDSYRKENELWLPSVTVLSSVGLMRYVASKSSLQYCDGQEWRSLVSEGTQLGGAHKSAGRSCVDIKTHNPSARDGVYWVNPNPNPSVYGKPFQVCYVHNNYMHGRTQVLKACFVQIYCDMTTAGGGWSMCYTTDFAVRLKSEHMQLQPSSSIWQGRIQGWLSWHSGRDSQL